MSAASIELFRSMAANPPARAGLVAPGPLRSLWGPDLAVDLGSSAFRAGSAVTQQIDHVGARVHGAPVMRGGVVADPERAAGVLRDLFARARRSGLLRPQVVVSHPSDVTDDEKDAFVAVARRAGAAGVATVVEPLSAAVGSGIDVGSPHAQLIVDIGHGVTDGIVLRGGRIVAKATVRLGCGDLQAAVVDRVAAMGGKITVDEALELIRELRFDRRPLGSGSVLAQANHRVVSVDLLALAETVEPWRESVLAVPRRLSRQVADEFGAELVENGVWLTGGGALLPGLVSAVAEATGLAARCVPEPLSAVVLGNRSLLSAAAVDAWA